MAVPVAVLVGIAMTMVFHLESVNRAGRLILQELEKHLENGNFHSDFGRNRCENFHSHGGSKIIVVRIDSYGN